MKGSDLHIFLKERLVELLHNKTLDSYRVRYHNALTAISELIKIVEGWQSFKVKRAETVKLCSSEVRSILDSDEILIYPKISKKATLKKLEEFENKLDNKNSRQELMCTHIVLLLNSILKANRAQYLDRVFKVIGEILSSEDEIDESNLVNCLQRIDNLSSALVRQLLCEGYSKKGLYTIVDSFLKTDNTIDNFNNFRDSIQGNIGSKYRVILSVLIKQGAREFTFSKFMRKVNPEFLPTEIEETLTDQVQNFIKERYRTRFFIYECVASDGDSAVKMTKKRLSEELDSLHVYLSHLNVECQATAIVIKQEKEGNTLQILPTKIFLDGVYSQEVSKANKFRKKLADINASQNVSNDVRERLSSALRHIRMGNNDDEIEQRFINYWIALEYLFSSPRFEEVTFQRLNQNLTTILSVNYVKRNLLYLERSLIKAGFIDEKEHIIKENINDVIARTTNLLLKYRLLKFNQRLFGNDKDRKAYVMRHESNLHSHLSRIYHLRNELIHEAAINQDIEDLTSNLRYYLISVITRIIAFMESYKSSTGNPVTLEEFFYEMELRKITIEESWSMEDLMRTFPDDI